MSESLLILLEGVATADIERSVVDAWISTFNRNRSYTHAESEVDSLEVIDSPWKLISIAPEVVWIGVEARRDITPELAFLYPSYILSMSDLTKIAMKSVTFSLATTMVKLSKSKKVSIPVKKL